MAERQPFITLFVYLGGMSAATGMVIVETIALSTMICNDLVMPVLLRLPVETMVGRQDYSGLLLTIRRCSIVLVLLLGYAYFRTIGEFYALVSIGLMSFALWPSLPRAMLGGIFWKGGTRSGAICGLLAGFIVWTYTLLLPSLAQAGIISHDFVSRGPFGIALLKPFELFGLQHFNRISHSVFWSMLANIGCYISVSIFSRPRAIEHTQAALFVDVFRYSGEAGESHFWRGTAHLPDLKSLLIGFWAAATRTRPLPTMPISTNSAGITWSPPMPTWSAMPKDCSPVPSVRHPPASWWHRWSRRNRWASRKF